MKYDEGDTVLIVAGDFEGSIGTVSSYENLFDRYLVVTNNITVSAKEWELTLMPDDIAELDDEYDTYRFRITVITPDSFNEFTSEHPNSVAITDFGMLEIQVIQDGMLHEVKAYAPGMWCTVHTKLEEVA